MLIEDIIGWQQNKRDLLTTRHSFIQGRNPIGIPRENECSKCMSRKSVIRDRFVWPRRGHRKSRTVGQRAIRSQTYSKGLVINCCKSFIGAQAAEIVWDLRSEISY